MEQALETGTHHGLDHYGVLTNALLQAMHGCLACAWDYEISSTFTLCAPGCAHLAILTCDISLILI